MNVVKLPLGGAVKYRGMTGLEEEILMDRKKMMKNEAIDEIMKNCVEAIGTVDAEGVFTPSKGEGSGEHGKGVVQESDILRMRTPDRLSILMAIRRESYGDDLTADFECHSCGAGNSVVIDLSTAKEIPLPDDYSEDFGYEVTLSNGQRVQFNYVTGSKERQVANQKGDVITMSMLARLGEVEGIDVGDRKSWLLKLPVRLRRELRKRMEEKDCGIDTAWQVECSECGAASRFEVQGQPSFFFPAQ